MATLTAQELKEKCPSRFADELTKFSESLGYEWWDCVFEDAKEDGKELGFHIDNIHFSGFWSQGDGASWEGQVQLIPFFDAHPTDDPKWHVLRALIAAGAVSSDVWIVQRGNYYHEMTMQISDGADARTDVDALVPDGVFAGASPAALFEAIGGVEVLDELDSVVLKVARNFAMKIYKQLEEEYEYLTGEEAFLEHCHANDVVFDVDDEEDES